MAKILIIDDSETERKLIGQVVTQMGHMPIGVEDHQNALAHVKSYSPDLILLDIVMPTVDGFTVCRQIRKDPETTNIPIVIVSTKSGQSDMKWATKQGANDYLTKPFTPPQLTEVIQRNL